jgi:mono/diheme cytochrome c family protein
MANQDALNDQDRRPRSTRSSIIRGVILSAAAGAILSISGPALAQDAAQVEEGLAVWKRGGCTTCHGTFAQGGEGGDAPEGPSLRKTKLERGDLVETIACGRPGSQMPFNLAGAYTEVSCWGMAVGEVADGTKSGRSLTAEEIEAMVEYLMARVVGKGKITLEECALYFGDPANFGCQSYQ